MSGAATVGSVVPIEGAILSASPVNSVFGRVGNILAAAGDYAASQVTNDSLVAGAFVADALNALNAAIVPAPVTSVFGRVGVVVAAVNDYLASQIANDSAVPGAQVSDALNALAAVLAALDSSDIANVSTVAGPTVTAALDALAAALGALDSSDIANVSTVAGATVTDALDALSAAIPTTRQLFFAAETNGSNLGHRIRNVGAAGNFDFNFEVPTDFNALVSLRMWGASRSATNPAAAITITSSYGVPPAGPQATSVAVGITPAFTTGQLFTYDISAAFAGLAAGAQAAVNVNHGGIGGSIDYYGIMMEYN